MLQEFKKLLRKKYKEIKKQLNRNLKILNNLISFCGKFKIFWTKIKKTIKEIII